MIHSSHYSPRVYPWLVDAEDVEIDRVQDLASTATLNRTQINEVGRDGVVAYRRGVPTINVTCRQFEYGNIEFYRKLANKGDSVNTINFTDFKTSVFDIAGYKTDDDGTFLGTIWYPSLRMSGFGMSIGDPDALIERNFTFVGEDEIFLQNSNKYLNHNRYVISTTGNNRTVTINNPAPTADPDHSGQYLFKVIKHSGGTATELNHGTDWSYNGAGTLTINGSSTAGDSVWVWYSSSTYTGSDTFVENNTDIGAISADSVSIYLLSNTYVYRLQSISTDTTLDRRDIKEIGSPDVVARGARTITSNITLGKIIEDYTIEEFLRGKTASDLYGKLSVRNYTDNLRLIIKMYNSTSKTTANFKMGWKWFDLAPTSRDTDTPVEDYITANAVLSGQTAIITTEENLLA